MAGDTRLGANPVGKTPLVGRCENGGSDPQTMSQLTNRASALHMPLRGKFYTIGLKMMEMLE